MQKNDKYWSVFNNSNSSYFNEYSDFIPNPNDSVFSPCCGTFRYTFTKMLFKIPITLPLKYWINISANRKYPVIHLTVELPQATVGYVSCIIKPTLYQLIVSEKVTWYQRWTLQLLQFIQEKPLDIRSGGLFSHITPSNNYHYQSIGNSKLNCVNISLYMESVYDPTATCFVLYFNALRNNQSESLHNCFFI